MPKLPTLSGHEVMKALSKAGFVKKRQKGSHVILVRENNIGKKAVVVPLHKEIDRGTLAEIIRQSGMKRDKFLELL